MEIGTKTIKMFAWLKHQMSRVNLNYYKIIGKTFLNRNNSILHPIKIKFFFFPNKLKSSHET